MDKHYGSKYNKELTDNCHAFLEETIPEPSTTIFEELVELAGLKELIAKIASNKMTYREQSNLNMRLKRLIDPKMMGEIFKVIFARNKSPCGSIRQFIN